MQFVFLGGRHCRIASPGFLKKSQAFLFFEFPKGAVETTEPETPLSEGGLQGHTMERKDHVEFYGSWKGTPLFRSLSRFNKRPVFPSITLFFFLVGLTQFWLLD